MIASDVLRVYRSVHSWIGITCGIGLFIAFYAGALTMFEGSLRQWAAGPSPLPPAPGLSQTPELLDALRAQTSSFGDNYTVHVETTADVPARVTWTMAPVDDDDHATVPELMGAALDEAGNLKVARVDPPAVPQLIDVLHQQLGLPLPHEWAMPITGIVALAYVVALVSGLIVLLPSIVKDLFALRIGANLKRMWLDVHNALGVFSIPFHLIMALTTVGFAFHDVIYGAQHVAVYDGGLGPQWAQMRPAPLEVPAHAAVLPPAELTARIASQAPDFTVRTIEYSAGANDVVSARVRGYAEGHIMRGPDFGQAPVDPYSGQLLDTQYLPGLQSGWAEIIITFFALHFGNFGGALVRWLYFAMGLAGAAVFYTGNLIWIESHRRRARGGGGLPEQSASAAVMGSLSVGACLGCIAGISITLAAAPLLTRFGSDAGLWHEVVFYLVFGGAIAWAWLRGAARGAVELLWCSALGTALIPLSNLARDVPHPGGGLFAVELTAVLGCLLLSAVALVTRRRHGKAPQASIWAHSGG